MSIGETLYLIDGFLYHSPLPFSLNTCYLQSHIICCSIEIQRNLFGYLVYNAHVYLNFTEIPSLIRVFNIVVSDYGEIKRFNPAEVCVPFGGGDGGWADLLNLKMLRV